MENKAKTIKQAKRKWMESFLGFELISGVTRYEHIVYEMCKKIEALEYICRKKKK